MCYIYYIHLCEHSESEDMITDDDNDFDKASDESDCEAISDDFQAEAQSSDCENECCRDIDKPYQKLQQKNV